MIKQFAIAATLLLAACTPLPKRSEAQIQIDPATCRAVEGAPTQQDRRGRPLYKYICAGKPAWLPGNRI